ncbi:MAG: Re/Si-specific NAD(P)(+) transhydrogenase subunit alpha [Deltaproteobacteria bacterium]|nr:Re/Si-specific NAD(P)(+) transhydrogenase subunit alpha [Deltaproteobacteria bacterium]
MRIGVPVETTPREKRVALIPETVKKLAAKKHELVIESGAGRASGALDDDYIKAGAQIAPSAEALYADADVILKLQAPSDRELALLRPQQTLISFVYPLSNPKLLKSLCARGVNVLAVDSIPRTTLAQMMDVLSSQATLAGYRAVLLAAEASPKLFPMLMTAAGTIAPAKVLVLGAGVAGLQAIATARRLGATVEAFDVRRVTKEQVESLGARFIEVEGAEDAQGAGGYAKEVSEETKKKQAALLLERASKVDAVITTALIPGKRAPILVDEAMVRAMRPHTVIVDIAAEQGGNCALTKPGERVTTDGGVIIVGELNLPAQMAVHASQMWSRNMEKLLLHLVGKEGTDLKLDATDEITRGVVTIRSGKIVDPRLVPAAKAEVKP